MCGLDDVIFAVFAPFRRGFGTFVRKIRVYMSRVEIIEIWGISGVFGIFRDFVAFVPEKRVRHNSSGCLGRMPCLETWRSVVPGGLFCSGLWKTINLENMVFGKPHFWKLLS